MPLYMNLSSTKPNCVTEENKKNKCINKGKSINDSKQEKSVLLLKTIS